jgi:hypothetical protein
VLNREERRDLVVLEDHLAARIDDEPDVEEAVLQIRVTRLGLGDDERVVLFGDLPQRLGLLSRDVDGALARELHVVHVQHFVVEALKRTLRERDQAHRNGEAGEP